jgi:hypothetical protein
MAGVSVYVPILLVTAFVAMVMGTWYTNRLLGYSKVVGTHTGTGTSGGDTPLAIIEYVKNIWIY